MPEIIETTVYRLDELSDAAKEKARAWYRQTGFDHDWFEFVYDDFERICAIIGVDLKTVPVRLYGGGTRQKPCIWFSGFWSQGDGACFEGRYGYAKDAPRKIRDHAPKDGELHRIADALAGDPAPELLSAPRHRRPTAIATTTNTAWRSRSSATARPART